MTDEALPPTAPSETGAVPTSPSPSPASASPQERAGGASAGIAARVAATPQTQQQNQQLLPPALPEDAAMNVTVSDPVQHTEGMNKKYTSYRVEVRPPGDNGGAAAAPPHRSAPHTTAVLRRYRDFSWLHAALSRERPGAVIPPLPEKMAVGNFAPEFVEERRAHLEQFLRRAYVHPELFDARCLDAFLRADDAAFNLAKAAKVASAVAQVQQQQQAQVQQGVAGMSVGDDAAAVADGTGTHSNGDASSNANASGAPPPAAAPPQAAVLVPPANPIPAGVGTTTANLSPTRAAGAKFKIKKWLTETKTQLTGKELVHSPDDHLFDEIEAYAEALERQMKAASARAASLVKKSKDTGADYAELGSVLEALGQAEGGGEGSGGGGGAGECLRTVGEAVSRSLAPLATDRAEAELHRLEEPLQDHVKYVQAVRAAVGKRRDRRLTYTTALNTLGVKRAALAKFHGSYGADVRRYDAEMSLQRAEIAAESARIEFEECSRRILREMDRFRGERAEEMRRTMMEYVKVQAEYSAKMGGVWAGLVPKLEAIAPCAAGGGASGGAGGVMYLYANGNAGRVPAPPAFQPHQPQQAMVQAPSMAVGAGQQQSSVPAVGQADQAGVPESTNGGAMIGGVLYRSTDDVDVIPGM